MASRWQPNWLDQSLLPALFVAIVAVALRVPSCLESFWVDELHSAWTVWDSLRDVFPRSQMGHQSPFYFVGLWLWKEVLGGGELTLRFSSVLAVALASGSLAAGLSRWTNSLTAGTIGGLLLAIERNSIFFGTELRPYAIVLFFGSIAFLLMLRLLESPSRQADNRAWTGLIASILLAALCQPTATGVLIWPVIVLGIHWCRTDWRALFRFQVSDALLMIAGAAVLFYLWRETLAASWSERNTWAAFASATDPLQIWRIWDWIYLLIVPLIALLIGAILARQATTKRRRKAGDDNSSGPPVRSCGSLARGSLIAGLLAVVCTSAYWVIAYLEFAPLWHRRYFIAILPCFSIVIAGSVGLLQSALRDGKGSRVIVAGIGATMLFALLWQQGTLQAVADYPAPLVRRGEDWRAAVRWVNRKMQPNDLVFVDAGLIEANQMLSSSGKVPKSSRQRSEEYLTYPVRGPYQTEHDARAVKLSRVASWRIIPKIQNDKRQVFVIARISPRLVNVGSDPSLKVYPFGNLSVIVQSD